MIQVIKEHLVKDVIGWTRQASYTTKDAFIDRIKAIPSAEPYKGMTNGEVIKAVFPNTKIITQYDNSFGDRFMVFKLDNKMNQEVYLDWWNSSYEPQESEVKE